MAEVGRYDDDRPVMSLLDPLETVLAWVEGLGSVGYVSDLLRSKHGLTSPRDVAESARVIALLSRDACGLAQQALSGPAETSFLPFYYSILNLSKICIVAKQRRRELFSKVHRYHGVQYSSISKRSRGLLTETLTLKENGAFPLYYQALTDQPWTFGNRKVPMRDVYSFVSDTSFEFRQAYGEDARLRPVRISLLRCRTRPGFDLVARLEDDAAAVPRGSDRAYLKLLSGSAQDPRDPSRFVWHTPVEDEAAARSTLLGKLRRYLIWELPRCAGMASQYCTPVSSGRLLLAQEFPIWLAFFHLSNVVRYNPEFLARLGEDRCWPMLLALRRDGFLNFCVLVWSFLHRANVAILK